MPLYLADLAWNHKGARYEKTSHERVSASSVGVAIGKAYREVKKRHPGSLREIPGSRFHFTITVIGRD